MGVLRKGVGGQATEDSEVVSCCLSEYVSVYNSFAHDLVTCCVCCLFFVCVCDCTEAWQGAGDSAEVYQGS